MKEEYKEQKKKYYENLISKAVELSETADNKTNN